MSTVQTVDYGGSFTRDGEDPVRLGLPLTAWVKIATVGALFCFTFGNSNLRRLWEKTNPFYGEANWQHACCVPLIGLYYLYVNRDALRLEKARAGWLGLPIAIFGLLLFGYGIWPGQNDFVKDAGMICTLYGVTALLVGWRIMRTASFPILFLVCAIPWPPLVYSKIAWPLQQLAANAAVFTLELTRVKAYVEGTRICIYGYGNTVRTLNVAEACAGLRSLMTFISIATAVAFLSSRPFFEKMIIVVMAVPIAIACNVMRVAGQGLLDHYVSQQLSEHFAHEFVGLIMLIPAFVMILMVGWVLDQIFIEETDEGRRLAEKIVRRVNIQSLPAHAGTGIVGAATVARDTRAKSPVIQRPAAVKDVSMTGRSRVVPPPPSVRLAPRPRANAPEDGVQ